MKSVAPLAGAWIEIHTRCYRRWGGCVAPLAGAWIEISSKACVLACLNVAPLAGAWIEMLELLPQNNLRQMSHPSRVRGLKFAFMLDLSHTTWSHPSRVRGLKLSLKRRRSLFYPVAPLAGAWIEISTFSPARMRSKCRTPRGCVD